MQSAHKFFLILTIVSSLLCSLFQIALAEEQEDLTFNLEQIVVTATKTPKQIKEVPATVDVITKEELEKRSVKRISDVLKLLPGVYIREPKGIIGSKDTESINIRGFVGGLDGSQKYIAFLVDGQPINNGFDGKMNLGNIPIENIERIEVMRGSSSALYGSSAMGGVINIITKEAPEDATIVRMSIGEMQTRMGSISHSGSAGKLDYFLDVKETESDGYISELDYLTAKPGSLRAMSGSKNGMDSQGYNAKFVYHFNEKSKLNIMAGKNDFSYFYEKRANKADMNEDNLLLSYENQINENNSFRISYGEKREEKDAFTTVWNTDGSIKNYTRDVIPSSVKQAEIQYNHRLTPKDLLTIGYVYETEKADIKTSKFNPLVNSNHWTRDFQGDAQTKGKTKNYAIYLQDEHKLDDRSTLYLGARYDSWHFYNGDNYKYDPLYKSYVSSNLSEIKSSNFSPKVGFVYQANDKMTLRTSLGKAFRAPNMFELLKGKETSDTIKMANPHLKPEESINYEIGMDYQFDKTLLGRITLFNTDFKNYITSKTIEVGQEGNTTGKKIDTKVNAGKAKIQGIEFGLEKNWNQNWTTFLNYTYTDAKIKESLNDPKSVGKQADQVPKNMFNFGVDYQQGSWQSSLTGNYVSDPRIEENQRGYTSYSSYFILDFTVSYKIDQDTVIALSVDNLLDKEYYSYYLGQPRTTYLEFSKKF